MGTPWVPSRFMLKPHAKRPITIFQNGKVQMASLNDMLVDAALGDLACALICSGSKSLFSGACSRIRKSAAGTVIRVNVTAKITRVDCQFSQLIIKVRMGVNTAMPAIEPVDRKNRAIPR